MLQQVPPDCQHFLGFLPFLTKFFSLPFPIPSSPYPAHPPFISVLKSCSISLISSYLCVICLTPFTVPHLPSTFTLFYTTQLHIISFISYYIYVSYSSYSSPHILTFTRLFPFHRLPLIPYHSPPISILPRFYTLICTHPSPFLSGFYLLSTYQCNSYVRFKRSGFTSFHFSFFPFVMSLFAF